MRRAIISQHLMGLQACDLCGLTGLPHATAQACVVALRQERDRLREELAESDRRARGEGLGLRQVSDVVGYGVGAIGIFFMVGKALVHLALALPLSELPTRPAFVGGLAAVLAGALIVGAGHGWLVRTAPASCAPVPSLGV